MVRVLPLLVVLPLGAAFGAVLGATRVAHAACPPAVALTGDAEAVRAVREQLDARGIAGETPSCPVLRAQIERRGAQLVVAVADSPADRGPGHMPGPIIERAVGGPATAATVIESWVRTDVTAPLLETRALPPIDAELAASGGSAPSATGIQLFAAAETSFASDRTVWEGLQLGACVMLGPICAAARVHAGKVVGRPAGWDRFARKGGEGYLGIDVPIALGRTRLTPGFAAGYGTMLTHHIGDDEKAGLEVSGPRAEAHVALAIPLTAHIAIDLGTTIELTQATGMEVHGNSPDASIAFPDEPRALFRFAVGVRYGAL